MMNKKVLFIPIFSILLLIFTSCYSNNKNSDISNSQITNKENNETVDINVDNSSEDKQTILNPRTFSGANLKYNNEGVPVLMYHSIDYEENNELRIPKEVFKKQMEFLINEGYTTLTLDELFDFLDNNKPIPNKSIVITFDDGYMDNYINAYPILKELNIKATIFVITDLIDNNKNYLTSSQIKEMSNNGIDIQSHTSKHEDLPTLSYKEQLETLVKSKKFLENVLNKDIKYIAYPFGNWNNDTLKAVKDAGYSMAVSTTGTWSFKENGIYSLDRVYISSKFDLNEFKRRISTPNYK
ncbi:polysaccharide deacetylase family protein [Clostridium cochlearium]|uniref:polysaccharide deacetylase family protein n=1 Tax=Clostridium cochlearium TaxID=1494 RepID=UPI003B8A8B9A